MHFFMFIAFDKKIGGAAVRAPPPPRPGAPRARPTKTESSPH